MTLDTANSVLSSGKNYKNIQKNIEIRPARHINVAIYCEEHKPTQKYQKKN